MLSDLQTKIVCLPQASIDRMMRIGLDVYAGLGCLCYNEAWKSIMKKLNSAGLVRKSIHVNFQDYFSLNLIAVPDMMSKELRTLICYRTVIVEFSTTDLRQAGVSESHADGTKIVVASLRLFAEGRSERYAVRTGTCYPQPHKVSREHSWVPSTLYSPSVPPAGAHGHKFGRFSGEAELGINKDISQG